MVIPANQQEKRSMKLLHIDSSALGGNSVSRQLSKSVVAQWRAAHPGTVVEYLDLAANAPSHLSADSLGFRLGYDDKTLTAAQRRENEISERLVSQFLAADVVVIGAPMYNFSIPTPLKAWIDRIAQVGRTFKYTDKGPQGLAGGKKIIIASTRGGAYSSNPALAFLDHQESYLKAVLGFFGISDVQIVRAEGMAMGDAAKAEGLNAAELAIKAAVAQPARQPEAELVA
jgi:FMN-dependent NADH-azoreductase